MRRKSKNRSGFTLVELLVVVAIVLILVTIALPHFQATLMAAREVKAAATMRTIHTAQAQYSSSYGRYAESLQQLGPPVSGTPGADSAALIDEELATGTKGGYRFVLHGGEAGYTITATPVTYNSSGSKTYYSDQSLIVREHHGPEPATINDPLVGQAGPKEGR